MRARPLRSPGVQSSTQSRTLGLSCARIFLWSKELLSLLRWPSVNIELPHVWTIILSIPVFFIIIVSLAAWRPEALRGNRPLQQAYANQFASDLFLALDGALRNLEPIERAEAWLTVADVITSGSQADASYSKFCLAVAARLKKLTNLANRS
jgi:hypothetical protein